MDTDDIQNEDFTSETVGLLILNELRLMRRDMKTGLMRLESKVDYLLNDPKYKFSEKSVESRESKSSDKVVDLVSEYNDPEPVYTNKSLLESSVNRSENGEEGKNDGEEEDSTVFTVHVDVNDLPDDVSLESFNEEDKKELASKKYPNFRATGSAVSVYDPVSETKQVFPVIENLDGRYQCTLCPSSFTKKGNLRRHYRYHTNDRRFECQVCSKKFVRKDYLYSHVKKHLKEQSVDAGKLYEISKQRVVNKLFDCSHCKRSFSTAPNLRRHLRLHTGEKPFGCVQCDQRFTRDDTLQKHVIKEHGKPLTEAHKSDVLVTVE